MDCYFRSHNRTVKYFGLNFILTKPLQNLTVSREWVNGDGNLNLRFFKMRLVISRKPTLTPGEWNKMVEINEDVCTIAHSTHIFTRILYSILKPYTNFLRGCPILAVGLSSSPRCFSQFSSSFRRDITSRTSNIPNSLITCLWLCPADDTEPLRPSSWAIPFTFAVKRKGLSRLKEKIFESPWN